MTHRNLESSLRKQSAEGDLAAMIVRPVATGRETTLLQARGHLAKAAALERFCDEQLLRIGELLRCVPGVELQPLPATAEMAVFGPAAVLRALVQPGGLIERDPNVVAFAHTPVSMI
jgi:hypothetical protein